MIEDHELPPKIRIIQIAGPDEPVQIEPSRPEPTFDFPETEDSSKFMERLKMIGAGAGVALVGLLLFKSCGGSASDGIRHLGSEADLALYSQKTAGLNSSKSNQENAVTCSVNLSQTQIVTDAQGERLSHFVKSRVRLMDGSKLPKSCIYMATVATAQLNGSTEGGRSIMGFRAVKPTGIKVN